jgi:hypothetical protein
MTTTFGIQNGEAAREHARKLLPMCKWIEYMNTAPPRDVVLAREKFHELMKKAAWMDLGGQA